MEHPNWQEEQYIQLFSNSEDFSLFSFTLEPMRTVLDDTDYLILAAALLALVVACGSDPTSAPELTVMPEPTFTAVSPSAASDATGTDAPTVAAQPRLTSADIPPCEGSHGGRIGDCAPEFAGKQEWVNSEPLTMDSLRGNVVLIDFWTYTCVNCIRTLPFCSNGTTATPTRAS